MLHLILLDCALELVPSEISSLKEIQKHASRKRKKPTEILLDQAYHGRAITKLDDGERRGRPDIVFHSLLSVLETPLCKSGLLTVHLHLLDGRIIEINPEVRLPRNYDRFVGLFEQLLVAGKVPPDGVPLLQVKNQSLEQIMKKLSEGNEKAQRILMVESGTMTNIEQLVSFLPETTTIPVIVGIGAFPHGDFSEEIPSFFSTHMKLGTDVLMAWHVCSEILWAYSYRSQVRNFSI